MEQRMSFWGKNAGRYDRSMRKDAAACEESDGAESKSLKGVGR